MATQQEILLLQIQTAGNEQLNATAKALVDLGKAGGDAAPLADALLQKLAQIAEQSTKTVGLVSLKAQLQEVGDSLFFAKQKAADLQSQFNSTSTPTAALTRNLDRANQSVASLDARYNTLTASIAADENALRAAGLSVENLDSTQRHLQATLAATRAEAAGLTSAHSRNTAAAKEEAVSLESLSAKYGAFGRVVESIKSILIGIGSLFALEKAKEEIGEILATGDKFRKWGDDFGDAFGSVELGAEALARVKEIAEQTPLSLEQVADAALKAKKEGLDPLDGSLLALIDANAKYGKDVDTLNATIEALGKAWNRGSLSQKEFVSLQQSGIPVARLLGEALNKTADEIEDMAKKGEIGRESIKLLITQLGDSATGNAKEELGTLSATVTKLRDQWEEFLKIISDGGVYDFALGKLQALTASIRQGLADGSLREKAQAIADAIVRIGQGAASTVKFLYDHSAAILEAARAYVVFRTALLAIDLAGAAARMSGLAAATKQVAAAAAAAGAENAGFFALGRAIRNIPASVKIAVATVGIDIVLSQTEKLVQTIRDWNQLNEESEERLQERIKLQDEYAAKAAVIAERFKEDAEVQVLSADQLNAKTRAQAESYLEQLQNATRYYAALRIQAEAVSNYKGAEEATRRLKELAEAQAAANERLKVVIEKVGESATAVINRFDQLRVKGESTASAIEGAFAKIEIGTPQGFIEVLAILRNISIRSHEAKESVQTELAGALAKLNTSDLRQFQQNVTKALKDAKGSADDLKAALQAGLEAELLKLGLTAQQSGAQFSQAGQEIIDTFSLIATNVNATAAQIQLAFSKALSQAQTGGEVDALRAKLQEAFDAGRLSAAQFQAGMEAAGRKLADVQVAAAKAGAELDGMGTAGTTAAQRISGALQETRDNLIVQANQIAKAINDALAAGDKAGAATLTAQFKSLDTEIASLNTEIDQLTPSYDSAADSGEESAQRQGAAFDRLAGRIGRGGGGGGGSGSVTDAVDEAGAAAQEAQRQFTEWGEASGKSAQELGADTSHANEGMEALSNGIANAREQYQKLSQAAAEFYDRALKGNFDLGHSDDGSGFDRVARAMQAALQATDDQIKANRADLQGMIDSLNSIGPAADQNFGGFGRDAATAAKRMAETSEAIESGNYQLGILGQQDLGQLQQALDVARQKVEAIGARALEAKAKLEDMAASIHDALLQEQGDEAALEDERHQKVLADLAQEAQFAGSGYDDAYKRAFADEQELHNIRVQNLNAQQKADQQQRQQQQQQASGSGSGGGVNASNPTASNGGTSFTVDHNINVSITGGGAPDGGWTDQQIQELTYEIIQALKRDGKR